MKPHHYLAIAVRIASVFLVIVALRQLAMLVTAIVNGMEFAIAVSSATVAVTFIAAALLWCFPATIARSIVSPELDKDIEPLKTQPVIMTLLLVLGVYFAFNAVADALYWVSLSTIQSANGYSHPSGLASEDTANMIVTGFELVLAVILISKARTITRLLVKVAG